MSAASSVELTYGGREYIAPAAKVLAAAFVNDPIGRYLYLSQDDLPNDAEISAERREAGFIERMTMRFVAGPELVEAGNWAAAALWFPPHAKLPGPDRATAPEVLIEFYDRFSILKKKYIGDRDFWYFNLLGRDPSRNDPGVITALILEFLKKAKNDGAPAWIEASGKHSRDVYVHLGFREVEVVMLAAGKADENGFRVPGGSGIPVYALIAEP